MEPIFECVGPVAFKVLWSIGPEEARRQYVDERRRAGRKARRHRLRGPDEIRGPPPVEHRGKDRRSQARFELSPEGLILTVHVIGTERGVPEDHHFLYPALRPEEALARIAGFSPGSRSSKERSSGQQGQ